MTARKLLRDKPTTLLMVMGFAIACFVLLNISNLVGKIMAEDEALNKYAYTAEVFVGVNGDSDIDVETLDSIIQFLQGFQKANIFIEPVLTRINGSDIPRICEVLLNSNEDLKLFDNRGRRIDLSTDKSGCVLIGETVSLQLNDKYGNGSQFRIHTGDATYEVLDILRSETVSGQDNSILFIWEKASEAGRAALKEAILAKSPFFGLYWGMFGICIKSDAPIDDIYQTIIHTLESDFGLETELYEAIHAESSQFEYIYKFYNSVFNATSLVFAVITVMSVTGLWVTRRKKEFVIRKAYGYTKAAMFKLLFTDAIKISIASLVVAALMQATYCAIFNVTFDVTAYFLVKCITVALGIILIVLLLVNHALKMIGRIEVIQGLKEGRV